MLELDMALGEGKKEYLAKYAGEDGVKDVVDGFWRIRSRARPPENDIDWWIRKPFSELKKFVDGFDARRRSVRRSDEHSRKAEKHGAKLMGERDGYEIWYVPSYEAAVELGRFYRNVSATWCISTSNDEYFRKTYEDSEFMFLVWAGAGECPFEGCEKLAVQVDSGLDFQPGSDPDYKLWDVDDNDLSDKDYFLDSGLRDTVDYAVSLFGKIPYNRRSWLEKAAETYVSDGKWLNDNIFKRQDSDFQLAGDGTVTAKYDISDLDCVISDRGVPYDTVQGAIEYDMDYFRRNRFDDTADYELPDRVVAGFNKKLSPYGISWTVVQAVARGDDADVEPGVYVTISEMLDGDFAEGNSYDTCYFDATESGTLNKARADILDQLRPLGVKSCEFEDGRYRLTCRYGKDVVRRLVREYLAFGERDNVFQAIMTDDGEFQPLEIKEPYYGWDDFDEDLMKEYVDEFANRLIGELTVTRDAPGQMRFDFDDEYISNPKNIPER